MSVIRVNHTEDYTVMSNYHLRDERLTLKAKGLLSQMLSLPPDWDYTVAGLVAINCEKESAINSALDELKKCGYLVVTKKMPNETKSGRFEYEYDIYETPRPEKQDTKKQGVEKQGVEIQGIENQGQLNIDILNTDYQEEKDTTNVVSKKNDGKVDIPTDAFGDADIQAKFEEWCSYRRAIHKSLKTQRGINGAIKTIREGLAKYGKQTVLESIDRCMEAEYQGLFIKPDNKGGNYRGVSPAFNRPYQEADYEYDEGDSL